DVAPTVWPVLTFASPVAPRLGPTLIECGESRPRVKATALSDTQVVLNPAGELPPDTDCELRFSTVDGPQLVAFRTAAAGPPVTLVYDRTDPREVGPYPDDFYTVADGATATGLRLDVPEPDGPTDVQLLFNTLRIGINQLDGFSPIGPLVLVLSESVDAGSLPLTPAESLDPLATVVLVDVTPGAPERGQRMPFRLEPRSDTTAGGLASDVWLLFPSVPLEPTHSYGLLVSRRVQAAPGRPLAASAFLAAALAPELPGEAPEVTAVRPLVEDVLTVSETTLVPRLPRDDLAGVVRFTVRSTANLVDDFLAIKSQIAAEPVPGYTITSVDPPNPSLPGHEHVAAIVSGTWEAPDWRGTDPDTPGGAFFARDGDGAPVLMSTRDVPFTLALPASAGSQPAPIVLYQHGNPGSSEDEVPRQARRFLGEADFAVIGFTDILNREVAPGPGTDEERIEQQVLNIFGLLVGFAALPDHWVETRAEQLAFLRFVQEGLGDLDVLPLGAPDGVPDLAVDEPLAYFGISEGGNNGQGFLAYAPEVKSAALVVGGSRLAEVLVHQQAQTFLDLVPSFFPSLTPADIWVGVSLFQGLFDRQDNHNHARFVYRDPVVVNGTTQKASILVTEGLEDSLVPNHATESLAWQLGPIPHLGPVQRAVPFLEVVTGPVMANIDPETTAAFYQYVPVGIPGIPPSPGCLALLPTNPTTAQEGHYCAQSAAEARLQRLHWFESALTGTPVAIDPLAP
ncbi:MAG: hypothetical protein MJE66_25330, partial [Proteobacteria bacterium]|nr:hypothetical protein [Pseudomonadota bacterium]